MESNDFALSDFEVRSIPEPIRGRKRKRNPDSWRGYVRRKRDFVVKSIKLDQAIQLLQKSLAIKSVSVQ